MRKVSFLVSNNFSILQVIIIITSSCARFATCRHMRIWHVAAVHLIIYVGMHQSEVYKLWIVRVVEAGSNVVYVAMTQVYSRAVMQQSTRYYIILLSLCFLHLCLHFNHFSTVTILCTCSIMHESLISLIRSIAWELRMRITGNASY